MPGIVQVKVVAARDLPIMDRSSELTDAFVEIKLGQVFHKTEVCPKTLNPSWDSPWFKFNVDDEDLQDEPLQIKLMDYDTYTAHDVIGKVYICLNSLIDSAILDGWFPIFDTLHGIRGEVHIRVKVEVIKDQYRFKQSSFGVQFFTCTEIPVGYAAEAIHGFVEELVVNDDPEYQWMDKIRTPRASNEARQRLFLKLSGELQRRVGVKALEAGGNAVVGYRQCFDLEGESGIVVRGIGTCVSLVSSQLSSGSTPVQLPAAIQTMPGANLADRVSEDAGVLFDAVTSPKHHGQYRRTSSSDSDGPPASPSKTPGGLHHSATVDSQPGTSASSGGIHAHPTPGIAPTLKHITSSSEFPFYTLTFLPPGLLRHVGGIVSARSVKLLDKINNPEEPETRDAWWQEVRNEVRSHTRAMGCDTVIGYSESTSICDTLCIFSAMGTAVCVGSGPPTLRKQPISPSSPSEGRGEVDVGAGVGGMGDVEGVLPECFPQCSVCHIPYSISKPPFEIRPSHCGLCHSNLVPSVLLLTCELPGGVAVRGQGGLVQARVCYPKRRIKSDENAFQVSKQLPFLEYKLHGQLLNKLYVKGMNAIFNLKIQVTVGDAMITGLATGTGVYLEALPLPSKITIGSKETEGSPHQLAEVQAALNRAQEENRKRYELDHHPPGVGGVGVVGELEGSGEEELRELDLSAGKKEAFIVDVDEQILKEEDLLEIIMDRPLPNGLHAVNTTVVPGIPLHKITGEPKMVVMVAKKVLDEPRQHLEKQFAQFFDKILQALAFRVRHMHPCTLCDIRFDVDLPEEDEIQVAVTAMAMRLGDREAALHSRKHHSEEMIFTMEEAGSSGKSQPAATAISHDDKKTQPVHMTPLSFLPGCLPGCHVERHLGMINLFLIRESTSIREGRGLDAFMQLFLLEAHAIARAHVAALGGNALLSYRLNECVLIEHPHKNQAQCLLNLGGDAAEVRRGEERCLEQPVEQIVPIPNSSSVPKETILYRVTEL